MKTNARFYHAGCPVCLEAEAAGVKSVPALVIGGKALHLNFGAGLADLK